MGMGAIVGEMARRQQPQGPVPLPFNQRLNSPPPGGPMSFAPPNNQPLRGQTTSFGGNTGGRTYVPNPFSMSGGGGHDVQIPRPVNQPQASVPQQLPPQLQAMLGAMNRGGQQMMPPRGFTNQPAQGSIPAVGAQLSQLRPTTTPKTQPVRGGGY